MISKYRNKKVTYQGVKFDSIAERNYYLILLKKYKKEDIKLQPKFILQDKYVDNQGNNVRAITYIADFMIGDEVYDVKGYETEVFKIKEKLFKKKYKKYNFVKVK